MSLKYGYSKRAELKARREDPLIVRVGKCNSPPHCLSASEEAEAEARWQQLRQQHKRLSELEKSHRAIDTSSSPSLVRDLNERSDSSSSGGSSSSDSSSDSSSSSSSSSDSDSSGSENTSDSSDSEPHEALQNQERQRKQSKTKIKKRGRSEQYQKKIEKNVDILSTLDQSKASGVRKSEARLNQALAHCDEFEKSNSSNPKRPAKPRPPPKKVNL